MPNKVGAEAVLYFLFNRLDPTLCRQQFRLVHIVALFIIDQKFVSW